MKLKETQELAILLFRRLQAEHGVDLLLELGREHAAVGDAELAVVLEDVDVREPVYLEAIRDRGSREP